MGMQKTHILTHKRLEVFIDTLKMEEKSQHTLAKYERDVRRFYQYCGGKRLITKADVIQYKQYLFQNYALSSANSMLTALNRFFKVCKWGDCQVKLYKMQRQTYREDQTQLKQEEYRQLMAAAREDGSERLGLLLQTLCATGIRVSELTYITVEAAQQGRTKIWNKGKSRNILIPQALCAELLQYAAECKIDKGKIFVTRSGKDLDRSNIWRALKKLGRAAQVPESKIFPHNLRHLFAKTFYEKQRDIAGLADLLGHGSLNTTRIYITDSIDEQKEKLNKMGLCNK